MDEPTDVVIAARQAVRAWKRIAGIAKVLEGDGWRELERSMVDLEAFSAPKPPPGPGTPS